MDGFMRFITDLQNLLSIGVGIAVFASVLTLLNAFTGGARLGKRMQAVAERREDLKRRSRQAMNNGASPGVTLRHRDEGFKKRVVDRLNLTKLLEDPQVVDKMAQAGFRGPRPLTTFYFFRFATPFIFMVLTGLYLFAINDFGFNLTLKLCALVFAAAAGFYAPNLYVQNRIASRRQSIVAAFPDSLDLLLICVESGMSIEAAIQKVSQEVGSQSI